MIEIWYRGTFEMLITKSKPKLRLENDLNKKCNYLSNLAKFCRAPFNNSITMATADVPWDWFVFRIKAYLLVYNKSQKVSTSYCLPFQHSRGKNQPVGRFRPPGLFRVNHFRKILRNIHGHFIQEPCLSVLAYRSEKKNRHQLFCLQFNITIHQQILYHNLCILSQIQYISWQ